MAVSSYFGHLVHLEGNEERKYSPDTALDSACLTVRLPVCLSERGGQLSGVNHLLPSVSSDAIGQVAEQRGGDPDTSVDIHQITSGQRAGLRRRGGAVVELPCSRAQQHQSDLLPLSLSLRLCRMSLSSSP